MDALEAPATYADFCDLFCTLAKVTDLGDVPAKEIHIVLQVLEDEKLITTPYWKKRIVKDIREAWYARQNEKVSEEAPPEAEDEGDASDNEVQGVDIYFVDGVEPDDEVEVVMKKYTAISGDEVEVVRKVIIISDEDPETEDDLPEEYFKLPPLPEVKAEFANPFEMMAEFRSLLATGKEFFASGYGKELCQSYEGFLRKADTAMDSLQAVQGTMNRMEYHLEEARTGCMLLGMMGLVGLSTALVLLGYIAFFK